LGGGGRKFKEYTPGRPKIGGRSAPATGEIKKKNQKKFSVSSHSKKGKKRAWRKREVDPLVFHIRVQIRRGKNPANKNQCVFEKRKRRE